MVTTLQAACLLPANRHRDLTSVVQSAISVQPQQPYSYSVSPCSRADLVLSCPAVVLPLVLQVYRAPAGKISPRMAEMRADLGSGE
jgi:hypothetical protein